MPEALSRRSRIAAFERLLLALPQAPLPVSHAFIDGVYARTMFIAEGVALTGAIHASENFFLVRQGRITVASEDGFVTLMAGAMLTSKPGHKRLGFAHTDTIITTFHHNPTNVTDPEDLWELYTVEDLNMLEDIITLDIEDKS